MKARHFFATALLLISLVPMTGCYFGRSSQAKTGAYTANAALAVVGGALLLSASTSGGCSSDADLSCGVGQATAAEGTAMIGLPLLIAGAIGIAINAAMPTRHDVPATKVQPRRGPEQSW